MTQDELKALVVYDPETGSITSRVQRQQVKKGQRLGWLTQHGYWGLTLRRRRFYGHQVAYLYVHGFIPKEIDHINRDKADNRISNLRPVTRSQNNMNRPDKPGRSGRPGVWKNNSGWCAFIRAGGKRVYLGNFPTVELASHAYETAKQLRDACEPFSSVHQRSP